MYAIARKKHLTTSLFLLGIACLYAFGIAAVHCTPTGVAREALTAYALPFDCMVVLPALFYLAVIRRNGLSPAFVLPIMWAGAAISTSLAQDSNTTVIAALSTCALVAELAIAVREITRFAAMVRDAKKTSNDAVDWFFAPLMQMTRNARASKLAANEMAMLYYAVFSWRRSAPTEDSATFTYHKDSGYTALIAGLMLVFPVETIAVHMLVSQWSVAAAWVLTIASLYTMLWIVGDCRASVLRPIRLHDGVLEVRSGLRFAADIPVVSIAAYEDGAPAFNKKSVMNLGVMGNASGWLAFTDPIEVETAFGGKKAISAIGIAVDDRSRFARLMNEAIAHQRKRVQDQEANQ